MVLISAIPSPTCVSDEAVKDIFRLTHLDTVSDGLVLRVGLVPLVGHAPFVQAELQSIRLFRRGWGWTHHSSGLQALVDLSVDALKAGSVARGFDSVDWGSARTVRGKVVTGARK